MLASQRQDRILADVQAHGAVRVTDLVAALDVSDMTVRRDIGELARRGLVRRVHGGAVDARPTPHEPEFAPQRFPAADDNAAIARSALARGTPPCAIPRSTGTTPH